MKLRPLSDRLIIRPIEETTSSGLVIPDTVDKEKPEKGEVLAVGPGRLLDNGQRAGMDIKVGDKILFTKYGPNEVKVNEEELLVISESDVMAVIE